MTSHSPEIREKMVATGFTVELSEKIKFSAIYPIIKGKKTRDGRDLDSREMCSIGEENLLCLSNRTYRKEDILVHEFSLSMMDHMDADDVRQIEAAYKNAVDKELYPKWIYMIANSAEYWAQGVQAWFGVTLGTDVGFNTQQKILDHDTTLAAVLEKVYGSANSDTLRVAHTDAKQNRPSRSEIFVEEIKSALPS